VCVCVCVCVMLLLLLLLLRKRLRCDVRVSKLRHCATLLNLITTVFFGSTAPIWALAYLHETLRFTSIF
jgi:hypothetical protein